MAGNFENSYLGNIIGTQRQKINNFTNSGEITTRKGGQFNPATGYAVYNNNRAYNTRTKQKGFIDYNMNKTYFTPDNSTNYIGKVIGVDPGALYGSTTYPR